MKSKEVNGKLTLDDQGELKQAEAQLIRLLRQENQGILFGLNRTIQPLSEQAQVSYQELQHIASQLALLQQDSNEIKCNLQQRSPLTI